MVAICYVEIPTRYSFIEQFMTFLQSEVVLHIAIANESM